MNEEKKDYPSDEEQNDGAVIHNHHRSVFLLRQPTFRKKFMFSDSPTF